MGCLASRDEPPSSSSKKKGMNAKNSEKQEAPSIDLAKRSSSSKGHDASVTPAKARRPSLAGTLLDQDIKRRGSDQTQAYSANKKKFAPIMDSTSPDLTLTSPINVKSRRPSLDTTLQMDIHKAGKIRAKRNSMVRDKVKPAVAVGKDIKKRGSTVSVDMVALDQDYTHLAAGLDNDEESKEPPPNLNAGTVPLEPKEQILTKDAGAGGNSTPLTSPHNAKSPKAGADLTSPTSKSAPAEEVKQVTMDNLTASERKRFLAYASGSALPAEEVARDVAEARKLKDQGLANESIQSIVIKRQAAEFQRLSKRMSVTGIDAKMLKENEEAENTQELFEKMRAAYVETVRAMMKVHLRDVSKREKNAEAGLDEEDNRLIVRTGKDYQRQLKTIGSWEQSTQYSTLLADVADIFNVFLSMIETPEVDLVALPPAIALDRVVANVEAGIVGLGLTPGIMKKGAGIIQEGELAILEATKSTEQMWRQLEDNPLSKYQKPRSSLVMSSHVDFLWETYSNGTGILNIDGITAYVKDVIDAYKVYLKLDAIWELVTDVFFRDICNLIKEEHFKKQKGVRRPEKADDYVNALLKDMAFKYKEEIDVIFNSFETQHLPRVVLQVFHVLFCPEKGFKRQLVSQEEFLEGVNYVPSFIFSAWPQSPQLSVLAIIKTQVKTLYNDKFAPVHNGR